MGLLWILNLLIFVAVLYFGLRRQISLPKAVSLVISAAVVIIAGARAFHVLWERPEYFRLNPLEALTRLDGLTYYGALFAGLVSARILVRRFIPSPLHSRTWDLLAITSALSYSLLRIGCFLAGCCWGRLCEYPWAVQYFHPHSAMPFVGLPVHPVQLYDSIIGAMIGGALVYARRRKLAKEGSLIWIFLVSIALGRIFTEYFRGDDYRGVGYLTYFSTSQVISGLLVFGVLAIRMRFDLTAFSKNVEVSRATPLIALSALFLQGCFQLPHPPGNGVIVTTQEVTNAVSDSRFEIHKMKNPRPLAQIKNLLFVALDETIQDKFKANLTALYPKNTPRAEELIWWVMSRRFAALYQEVVRVPYTHVNSASLTSAIKHLEAKGEKFDIVIFNHGFPNHISSSVGFEPISWKDLGALEGQAPHLELVFMHTCYGSTLTQDWKKVGAQAVVAYPELNSNFIHPLVFFDRYDGSLANLPKAMTLAQEGFAGDVDDTNLRRLILHRLLAEAKVSREQYLRELMFPVLE